MGQEHKDLLSFMFLFCFFTQPDSSPEWSMLFKTGKENSQSTEESKFSTCSLITSLERSESRTPLLSRASGWYSVEEYKDPRGSNTPEAW